MHITKNSSGEYVYIRNEFQDERELLERELPEWKAILNECNAFNQAINDFQRKVKGEAYRIKKWLSEIESSGEQFTLKEVEMHTERINVWLKHLGEIHFSPLPAYKSIFQKINAGAPAYFKLLKEMQKMIVRIERYMIDFVMDFDGHSMECLWRYKESDKDSGPKALRSWIDYADPNEILKARDALVAFDAEIDVIESKLLQSSKTKENINNESEVKIFMLSFKSAYAQILTSKICLFSTIY